MRSQKLVSWWMLLLLLKLPEKPAVNDAVSEVGKLAAHFYGWRMLLLLLNLPENKLSMMQFQKLVSWRMLLLLLKLPEKPAVNDVVTEVG